MLDHDDLIAYTKLPPSVSLTPTELADVERHIKDALAKQGANDLVRINVLTDDESRLHALSKEEGNNQAAKAIKDKALARYNALMIYLSAKVKDTEADACNDHQVTIKLDWEGSEKIRQEYTPDQDRRVPLIPLSAQEVDEYICNCLDKYQDGDLYIDGISDEQTIELKKRLDSEEIDISQIRNNTFINNIDSVAEKNARLIAHRIWAKFKIYCERHQHQGDRRLNIGTSTYNIRNRVKVNEGWVHALFKAFNLTRPIPPHIQVTYDRLLKITDDYLARSDKDNNKRVIFGNLRDKLVNPADNWIGDRIDAFKSELNKVDKNLIKSHRTATWVRYLYNILSVVTIVPVIVRLAMSQYKYGTLRFWRPESKQAVSAAKEVCDIAKRHH